jgi:phosphatidylinositol 4-phosphatase
MGTIQGHVIYKIEELDFIPIGRKSDRGMDNDRLLEIVEQTLQLDLYYCCTRDITRNYQQMAKFSVQNGSLWEQADDPFFFNRHAMNKLIQVTEQKPEENLSRFIIPVICGFVHIREWSLRVPFTYAIISRRSRYRVGTRYHSRGTNEFGHVSNFVETEQVVLVENGMIRSFVQVRGSIPLFWEQRVSLAYKPKLVIHDHQETHRVFKQHFSSLFTIYGPQIAINLINSSGYEQPLALEFSRQASLFNNPNLRYIHFDFHHECRKMQWHRISVLIDQIEGDLEQQR